MACLVVAWLTSTIGWSARYDGAAIILQLKSTAKAVLFLHNLPHLSLRGAKRRGNLPVQYYDTAMHSDDWCQEIATA